ncbi:MAG: hypothetical protein COA45_08670 [Zetaproteobacteria bacterium]|nr:MAG: hypothetical protein COA45_08670 [Zetaproteobacteria bacterium]
MSTILVNGSIQNNITFPFHFDSYDYRAICFFTACIIYAVAGSPTPDNFGWVEVFIGLFLALSVGIGRARDAILQPLKNRFWKTSGQVFLIYGLSVPLVVAALSGHSITVILRDVFPFLFLFLPMFLLPLIRARPAYFISGIFVILLIGFLFSLRSLVMHFIPGCPLWCGDELLYLENMPTVLFACLLMIGSAMTFIMRGITIKNIIIFSGLIFLSLIPIAAMEITLQRASLGAVVIYIIVIYGYFLNKSPARALSLFVIGAITLLVLNLSFSSSFHALWVKTSTVGLNMRPQEFEAVWSVVTSSPYRFLFGIGWGGHFSSPAVGGLSVNFTHNFFSTVLLKTGILGIIFCISYIAGILERLSRVVLMNPVLGFALAAPILIDLCLYASFKSLDFGLVLLMISSSLVYLRQSESLHV